MTDKEQLFNAVNLIQNQELRDWTRQELSKQPDNFWIIPASSTGKYHPEHSQGEGGLIRHILAALYFARELFEVYSATDEEKDIVIAALILHDIAKAVAEPHDIVAAQSLRWSKSANPLVVCTIAAVRWHMGPWATGSTKCHPAEQGLKRFPEDFSRTEQVTHFADYMASRKRVNLTKLGV